MTETEERLSWNQGVIEEFRANGGKVGGNFAGMPIVLLTTTGSKTGNARTSPLVYLPDGDRVVVFASNAGRDTHPLWYRNILADPTVTVEVDGEKYQATAVEIEGAERIALFARQVAINPGFGDYERGTSRVIPVIALERIA
jgi:deazaflavin-dependent oxidoreductase (nitroreductase family)